MNIRLLGKWVSSLITIILFVTLVAMAFIVISARASGGEPQIAGYQLKTVLSGSMEPEMKTGSIIAVKPGGDMTRFQKEDVITFVNEDEVLVTHRVIDVVQSGENVMYQTKGDNNNGPDPTLVLSDNVVAEYKGFTIPYIGYLANFAQSKEGSAILLVLPGILLLAYAGFTIWKSLSQLDTKDKNEDKIEEEQKEPEESIISSNNNGGLYRPVRVIKQDEKNNI
ncbi:signal peptidase I [Aquibacillus koreensis]|uniref:Signal peptidase I n=1 Tax=Aquibacillus koreensis TaxID=279446 RepID=A0A9X3WIZ0_9BACI|nr:signal peptidase I [Aquibacillus koreensis]MCT2534619.1 signal peptidase I [Aquibacillus koreensis]MDC3419803.1 signal peptidase I [Aquibacillus koreensis]